MDYKCTLDTTDSFLDQLKAHQLQQEKVSLLLDVGGWERAEGMIREIGNKDGVDYLVLDNGASLNIATIVAVNGVFKTDCSC